MDPHPGTLEDYQRLSRGLPERGMYLVQDVVLNHMANCGDGTWRATISVADMVDPNIQHLLVAWAEGGSGLLQHAHPWPQRGQWSPRPNA